MGSRDRLGEVKNPTPGVATYVNEYGFKVRIWHYSADPGKRGDWADVEAQSIPDGRASDHWQQEQEINFVAVRGRQTYYAFDRRRNVVPPMPLEELRTWTWFLSFDFGATDPTCCLFWAEDPATRDLVIWDSVYRSNTPVAEMKRLIYAKLREARGVGSEDFDIRASVRYAVGDPQGKGYMMEYGARPWPIYIGGNTPQVKLNDRRAGETRLNNYFAPRIVCCEDTIYADVAICPRCKQERKGRPRLVIFADACPELVSQLPTIRKKVPKDPTLEIREEDVSVPDHAVDAAKYGAMSTAPESKLVNLRIPGVEVARDMTSMRTWESINKRMKRLVELEAEEDDGGDPLAIPQLFGLESDAEDEGQWM